MVYSDSDQVQDARSCKFMTSYFTFIAYEVTFWMSYQQKTVALF